MAKNLLKYKSKLLLCTILYLLCMNSFAQKLVGGIEIGSKGIKVTVLEIDNIKKGKFELKSFWTDNTGIARGISIDGNLRPEDIENSCQAVLKDYNKLLDFFKIDKKNIYVAISSGVGLAKNTDFLKEEIMCYIDKQAEILTPELEAKLLVKGGIPTDRYLNSLMVDIGAGNTKGGFIDVKNEDNFVFFPIKMDLGTITLTEKIKTFTETDSFDEFLAMAPFFTKYIKFEVEKMFKSRPTDVIKRNVYLSGGAVWAFKTLTTTSKIENFSEISLDEVKKYQNGLINNFARYEQFAIADKEAEKVLKTYSRKHLIAANIILTAILEEVVANESKYFYFIKQGQIAWLLAYTLDSANNGRVIY